MEWRTERRSNRRYPIHLDLEYRAHHDRTVVSGRGQIVNVSSLGILFESDSDLPLGMSIELWIDWPVLLNGDVALRLHGKGRIVRAKGNRIAVTIKHFDLRITSCQEVR